MFGERDLAIFKAGGPKSRKNVKFSKNFEKFSNFQKSSKYQNLSVWGIVSTEKSGFFAQTKKIDIFRTGLNRAWRSRGERDLANFTVRCKNCNIVRKLVTLWSRRFPPG